MLELKKSRNQQSLNNDRKKYIFSRLKYRTEKTFFKGSCKFCFFEKTVRNQQHFVQKTIQLVIALVARRSYSRSMPPTFENKLLAKNKDLEKLPGVSTVVLDKDKNLLWVSMTSQLSQQLNDAITYFTCSSISRHWELFSKIVQGSFFQQQQPRCS